VREHHDHEEVQRAFMPLGIQSAVQTRAGSGVQIREI
jgi:hypothetical protein